MSLKDLRPFGLLISLQLFAYVKFYMHAYLRFSLEFELGKVRVHLRYKYILHNRSY